MPMASASDSHMAGLGMGASASRAKEYAWLLGAMFVIIALLIFRSSGLHPVVLNDEYTYSMSSRLLPLSASNIPGYLYLAIYRVTNVCGNGYYDCARVLNALFFVAAAPFVYAVARNVCSRAAAAVLALATFAGPINSYTAYFMPEALYFLAFWAFSWQLLRTHDASSLRGWAAGGALIGVAALVKPHALLCLPAVVAYVVCVCRNSGERSLRRPLMCATVLCACALATKLAISYVLAGGAGLTLFGSLYTSIARDSTSGMQHFTNVVVRSTGNAWAHFLAMAVLFAVPFACIVQVLVAAARSRTALDATGRVALYAFLVLIDLVVVTALFSASTGNAARLHVRYYNFAFPLLLMVVASPAAFRSGAWGRRSRGVVAVLLALAILTTAFTHLRGIYPNIVDCPEFAGLLVDTEKFDLVCSLGVVALALWAWAPRVGARTYLFVCVPVIAAVGTYYINALMRERLPADAYDRAAQFAKQYLPKEDIANVLVVGTGPVEVYRALFQLDSPSASMRVLADGSAFDLSQLPAGDQWALVVGDHPLIGHPAIVLDRDGFRLVRNAAR
jgi:phosphoglycerol transferase